MLLHSLTYWLEILAKLCKFVARCMGQGLGHCDLFREILLLENQPQGDHHNATSYLQCVMASRASLTFHTRTGKSSNLAELQAGKTLPGTEAHTNLM